VARGMAPDAEVLKVHHHGHADSSEPAWLDALGPRVALIPIVTWETWNGGASQLVGRTAVARPHRID